MTIINKTFHVLGGNAEITKLLTARGMIEQKNLEEDFDLLVLSGGSDICPFLYGEKPLAKTYYNVERDLAELKVLHSLPYDINKVGICRGAQLLNVFNGGRLWQHVDEHTNNHLAKYLRHKQAPVEVMVSSTHHQMMRPTSYGDVFLVAGEATQREAENEVIANIPKKNTNDIEGVHYWHSNSLCFQPHPEYGPASCVDLFFEVLQEKLFPARQQTKDK